MCKMIQAVALSSYINFRNYYINVFFQDIPIRWNIDLLPDTPNPVGVLRSKAIGEPPICMAVCVAIALKRAVEASRKDRGLDQYFTLRKCLRVFLF